ncbi:hypothetical protein NIES2098_30150 [Calothrix sp. NIES-2098]|nr:hypothetical protein NIES2098_30150 [Calothrix sp. NIES-2098]
MLTLLLARELIFWRMGNAAGDLQYLSNEKDLSMKSSPNRICKAVLVTYLIKYQYLGTANIDFSLVRFMERQSQIFLANS